MGRAPCCDKASVKKGHWSPEEDKQLKEYIEKNGTGGNWIALPHKAGLNRCGKSCRLRWLNYLRPNIKHGSFSDEEDRVITNLYASIGSRWSIIAGQLPGRTDNDIKNYWNTKLKKKFSGILTPPRRLKHQHQHQHQQQCSGSYAACFPTAAAALDAAASTNPLVSSLQGLEAALPISALLSSLTSGGGGGGCGGGGGGPTLLQTPEQQQQSRNNLIKFGGGGGMGCLGNAAYSDAYLNEAEHGASSAFESYLYGCCGGGGGGGGLEVVDLAGSRDSTELGFGLEEYEMPMLPPSNSLYLDAAEMMSASSMCFY